MFRLDTPEARAIFAQIITKRVEKEAFIELDALDLIVKKSGGCARQLLDIAINAYKKARGNKITLAYLQHALEELGRHMNDHISEAESAILQDVKKGIFHRPNSPVVTRLINELSLLKYDDGSYAVNPLLEDFL